MIYRWELPADIEPLREAARRLAAREVDTVLFTSSIQWEHLMVIAESLGILPAVLSCLREYAAIASVGPVMSASLIAAGIPVEIVPVHPKMAALVKAAAEMSAHIIKQKRGHEQPL